MDGGTTRIYRAKWFAPSAGEIVEDGAIAVQRGCVVGAGPFKPLKKQFPGAGKATDLGERILFPGLVNAHAHLEFTCMRRALLPTADFAAWLARIGLLKRNLEDTDFLASIVEGIGEAARTGTTTVFSMISFPQLLPRIEVPPIRVWWFYEVADLRHRLATDELIRGALMFFERKTHWPGGFGISPHSPYSASPALYDLTRLCSAKYGMPWTTHVGESEAEFEMFQHARGPLYDFLVGLGRGMEDCGGTSPLRRVFRDGKGDGAAILVHLNYFDPADEALLAGMGGKLSVVHCPSSHRFFGHRPFDLAKLEGLGARIALGTDSGATRSSLDLRDEMSLFLAKHPGVPASKVWQMVTANAAAMVRCSSTLGHLRPGAKADFVLWEKTDVAPSAGDEEFWRALIEQREPPSGVWVGGRKVAPIK